MKKEIKEFMFKLSGSPVVWRHKADELKHAAEVLRIEIDRSFKEANEHIERNQKSGKQEILISKPIIISTYNMLLGFSIENLFKGIVLVKNPEHLTDEKLSDKLKIHDLFALADLAQINLTDKEKTFCNIANEAVLSSGRYPIPLKANAYTNIHHLCDKDIFEALFIKLRSQIKWYLD